MLVLKFGGTSMGTADSIKNKVVPIILGRQKREKEIVVVVSAMTGVTNDLLAASEMAIKGNAKGMKNKLKEVCLRHHDTIDKMMKNEGNIADTKGYISDKIENLETFLKAVSTVGELSARSHDIVLAVGEKLSAKMLSALLVDMGHKSSYVNLSRVIPGSLSYDNQTYWDKVEKLFKKRLTPEVEKGNIPVATGFFGPNPGGILAAVGRGYSDFSAALCGAAMKSKEIEIWTDVDGILSTNPKVVPEAKILPEISFEEASELSHFGAKVLHPQSIRPALNAHIPIRILNTFNATCPGTVITHEGKLTKHPFKSIAYMKGITIMRIQSLRMLMQYGFMARIFDIFKAHKISVNLISTAESSVSLTLEHSPKNLKDAINELKKIGNVTVMPNQAIVSVVGAEMQGENYIQGEIFEHLSDNKIKVNMASLDAGLINISVVIDEAKTEKAVQVLHKLFLSK
jgi:aspartate kinase